MSTVIATLVLAGGVALNQCRPRIGGTMTHWGKDVTDAITADVSRILEERFPEDVARAKAAHARSERLALGFAFTVVPAFLLGAVLFMAGAINPLVALFVPALLNLGFLTVVILGVIKSSAASRPLIEYAKKHLGQTVTGITQKGITVAAPTDAVWVPAELRETHHVMRQPRTEDA